MSKMTFLLESEAPERVQASAGANKTAENEQTGGGKKLAPWHPVPTRLVDAVMPRLRDTELRVLLIVLRQTWGWRMDRGAATNKVAGISEEATEKQVAKRQGAKRQVTKRRDWLSHRQLCRRTGRGSDAVSAAVASLTASGLIIVEDASGRPLATPQERRRCLGRLYFRPGTTWLE